MVVKFKSDHVDYPLIHKNELDEREEKHNQHIEDVKICWALVQDAKAHFNYLMEEKRKLLLWERYLHKSILPKPWCPPEIRLFLERLRHFEQDNVDKTVDWTLMVAEDGLLSQNIPRKELTRKTLRKIYWPKLGEYYGEHVKQCRLVIRDIDEFMDDEYEFSLLDLRVAKDVVTLRYEVESEIHDVLDKFTYRIISAKDTYMESVDGLEAFYSYEGKDLSMDIWALRDVCVRFDQLDFPCMLAKFPTIGVVVQIPISCLSEKLVLRCIHYSFDSFSSQAKTYEQIVTQSTEDILGGVPDIIDELIKEWEMQMDIMYDIRRKMLSKHADYEEVFKLVERKVEESKKLPLEERSKFKIPKLPKEPKSVAGDMYPDTFNLLREREQSQYEQFMYDFFHPDRLNLLKGQVNLKKYIISGGTYNLFFLSTPKHNDFNHFNVTTHVNSHKLIILKDIIADLDYFDENKEDEEVNQERPKASTISVISRIDVTRSRAEDNAGVDLKDYQLDFNDLPYFFVTLQLPSDLCRWEWPAVCHFEESETEIEELRELDETLLPRPAKPAMMAPTEKHFSIVENVDENKSDSDMEVDKKRDTSLIDKSFHVQNVLKTRQSSLLRSSVLAERLMEPNVETVRQKYQIRALERYCLPRIISSFEFPVELNEQQNSVKEQQSSPRFGLIYRKDNITTLNEVEENKPQNCQISYEEQNSPEYVFPIFDDVKDDILNLNLESRGYTEEIQNLTNTFEDIRKKYMENSNKILDQKDLEIIKKTEKRKSDLVFDTKAVISKRNLPPPKRLKSVFKRHMGSGIKLSEQGSMDYMKTLDFNELMTPTGGEATIEEEKSKEPKVYKKVYHWTKSHIFESYVDKANMKIIVKTDRLGVFGLAFNRYTQFPFSHWCLRPNEQKADELIFTLDTPHVHIELNISNEGFTGYVTDLLKEYVAKPIKHLIIDEPIIEINILKKRFLEKNLNIFPDVDATFYIKNGYFSEKHLATENHVYETIAVHCILMKFFCSNWNRLAQRFDLILCLSDAKERDDSFACTVRVTPQEAKFVEITELCSNNMDVINLQYKPTWRNSHFYADLHHLINSISPKFAEGRNENSMLMRHVLALFTAIRPLSFG